MSADPTAEHIDAVARTLAGGGEPCEGTLSDAEIILTSKRPEVHAALAASLPAEVMLAALVDRGTLTEERERLVRACGCIASAEPAGCCNPLAPPHWERRLITGWEVAP